jgi:BarA-like signal transduction histidine kinase
MNIFITRFVQVLNRTPVKLCYSTRISRVPFRHRFWILDKLTRNTSARTAIESKQLWVEQIL